MEVWSKVEVGDVGEWWRYGVRYGGGWWCLGKGKGE